MSRKVALIHATQVAIDPIHHAMRTLWPDCQAVNLLDDSLSADRAVQKGALSDSLTDRIVAIADYAAGLGSDGVLYTCSAFGSAIDKAASRLSIPVLKPNEAMFEQALDSGDRIAMLYTFEPARAGMEQEFREMVPSNRPHVSFSSHYVPGAMDALRSADPGTHNRLVATQAARLEDVDVIMLAHFSTTRAAEAVRQQTRIPVLTSPDCAINKLKDLIGN
ncbi:hypothetical protein ACUNV4_06860 [Granulosicoccus sp. 3-233]|uniref:hypothetical protein n=1 Tax=Granulosicoccus sp. 3-233 TaxID=3417969 RepID=UPI003D3520E2